VTESTTESKAPSDTTDNPRVQGASSTDRRKATPAEQQDLVTYLHERLRSRFAGDGPEHELITDRFPSKVLQLGILPPLPQPEPDAPETPEELARLLGRAPSAMGLDFELDLRQDGTAELELQAEFSVYIQRYPTRDEQHEFHVGGAEEATEEEDEQQRGDAESMRLKLKFGRLDIDTGPQPAVIHGSRGQVEIPLDDLLVAAIGPALTDQTAVYPFAARTNQTLPVGALDGDQVSFERELRAAEGDARHRPLEPPKASMIVTWQPTENGRVRVQATLRNDTLVPLRNRKAARGAPRSLPRDLELFNSRLRVFPVRGELRRMEFHRAPKDFRYAGERAVWAVGRNAHARRLDAREHPREPLTTETWPVFVQKRMESRHEPALQLSFGELADPTTFIGALGRISSAMKDFEAEWEIALEAWAEEESRSEVERALQDFRNDMAGFERGLDCLRRDARLKEAFCAANEVFRRLGEEQDFATWRLFQVVYQVAQLQALRVREVPQEESLRSELDIADVLWFPTGGGKTEAYLGLIITALFYDRFRGKERGVTAMLRFPLRMLSVQQLQRMLKAVAFAEVHRLELLAAGAEVDGDAFALGYWAGSDNSPNSLVSSWREKPRENIRWWVEHVKEDALGGDDLRIVTICPQPACGGKLRLQPDDRLVRLRHVCERCNQDAPVYITDEEVYRYLPAVLVSTVDKLAHVARAEQFLGLLAGPAFRCPDHGYFNWHTAVWSSAGGGRFNQPTAQDRCLAGELCHRPAGDYRRVGKTKDPCPAIVVQDELHLLEEELGTFSAHYDTLLRVLEEECGDGLPSKILAATATIEAFEEQVRNLYGRDARVFPSPGYMLGETFYVETNQDVARRIYVGALPARPDVQEFGALAQGYLHEEVMRLQDDLSGGLAVLGWAGTHSEDWLDDQLLDYELTLGYVNRKQDADKVASTLRRLPRRGLLREDLETKVLIGGGSGGGTPLAEIADVLQRVIDQYRGPRPPRAERLRAWVATSLISHGVDLDALNLMVVNGMTPTVAQYVQASSRSGRTQVGLVLVAYNRRAARERSYFQFFTETHAFLDRMIAPVPVNRFARFAVATTMPGLVSALVLQVYGLQRLAKNGRPDKPTPSLVRVKEARKFLTGTEGPADTKDHLLELTRRALGVGATVLRRTRTGFAVQPVFDPRMTQWMEQEAGDQLDRQWDHLTDPVKQGRTASALSPEPLASFRQVDEPMNLNVFAREADVQAPLAGTTPAE
jgi:hypothetical protein